MKTKHLQKKAEKRKVTRSLKHKKISEQRDIKSMLRRRLDHIVTDAIKNNAKDGKQVSEIKEYRSKIRQILSWFATLAESKHRREKYVMLRRKAAILK